MRAARKRRFAVLGAAAALALVTPSVAAHADTTMASQLSFSPDSPTADPYGQGTTISGDVSTTDQGWLDFFGRSVVTTPDRANLNAGTSDFSFGARIALTRGAGDWNVMQKGNWADQQWKLSTFASGDAVRLGCRFNGSAGALHVITDGPAVQADGTWHDVACVRSGDTVQVLVDGASVAQGSGPTGSISTTKPYLIGSKGLNAKDPDQFLGLLDDAFVKHDASGSIDPPPPPPADNPPTANLDVVGCTELTCSFDASASSDPDGDPLTFAWDFGDGTKDVGAQVTHQYPATGTYTASVDVTDPAGATSKASAIVDVTAPTTSAIAFRDVAGASTNSTSVAPRIPATAQPGDALLLFVSANRSDVVLNGPSGWQPLGTQVDDSMQSQLWVRVAQAGDAGAAARVTTSANTKMTAHVLDYSGTSTTQPVATARSAAETRKTASHTTPVVATSAGSWLVSLWSNKSSSTTDWTAPAGVDVRGFLATSGSGRVTSLAADSGGAVATTSAGGLTATASQTGGTATMWSVVLAPA